MGKSGFPQHGFGGFPAPHRAKTVTALPERNRRTMQAGYGVEQRGEGKVIVIFQICRTADVLHQMYATRAQCGPYALEEVLRLFLIMDRVKGRDQIEMLRRIKICQVPHFK